VPPEASAASCRGPQADNRGSTAAATGADQRAIVKAISRATRYATQHGVVVVAAAVNEATDLAHPETDELSFDFHPARRLPGMSAPVRRAGRGVARGGHGLGGRAAGHPGLLLQLRQRMDKPGSSTLGGHAADQSIPRMAV
jgi:hypothetical protein